LAFKVNDARPDEALVSRFGKLGVRPVKLAPADHVRTNESAEGFMSSAEAGKHVVATRWCGAAGPDA
jgi:hypothetical protein